ncbi:MAG: hypothetical protein CVT90_00190 [Candidatus Altiarchaeales archaeon HGW-Altiarchaeales-3]|nr:MAG: hypothetical protein CVT90_00190 [Candidatus Altiarchaeales archaeon HGW-Altiarchaeales-3]
MKLKTMFLKMESDKLIKEDSAKLRGFFANKFNNYLLLHNHLGNNKFLYQYPRIQYKTINYAKMILGLAEGVDVLQSIYNQYDQIVLDGHTYQIFSKEISLKIEDFGISSENTKYEFITPWFALNEENYQRYKNYNYSERTDQLKSILIRNIMAIAKTFQYFVDSKIIVNTKLKETTIKFKGEEVIGFLGTFQVNFNLPDCIGLGKSVSRGFGTIKKINN